MEDFDIAAKEWETEERKKRALSIAGEIRCHIKESCVKTALEYGCGTGLVGFSLLDSFKTLYFMDSSRGMLEQVKGKLSEMGLPEERAVCFDLMSSQLPDIKVDCIFTSLVLHHIKDTQGILSRFHSILNKGGRLIVVDLDADDGSFHEKYPDFDGHNGYDQSELCKLVREVGFTDVTIKTFFRDIKKGREKDNPYSIFILDASKP